ncbi:hypothetical protein JAAARDRAFT_36715 [Jaapia argillacea MUCL 33604]|uniref:Uncharacterized protein n=1 Tax=Jaapia argillacea MUCL 33604 TaxID=933084 RepID=A0A067PMD6_9AGAM|nr:hypothetical protein JAAARDRAFT_36715 [Jaapia argillacea MUCL 33604]
MRDIRSGGKYLGQNKEFRLRPRGAPVAGLRLAACDIEGDVLPPASIAGNWNPSQSQ